MQIRTIPGAYSFTLFALTNMAYGASVGSMDRNFMITAARAEMTEAHEGQLAEDQAARADVKDFAKTLVQDRSDAYWHLSELAAKTGVSIPKGINAATIPAIREMVHLKGERFDREFAREEIAADRQALTMFKREAAKGHDPDVKAYATQTIPVLEKDLQLAEKCAGK